MRQGMYLSSVGVFEEHLNRIVRHLENSPTNSPKLLIKRAFRSRKRSKCPRVRTYLEERYLTIYTKNHDPEPIWKKTRWGWAFKGNRYGNQFSSQDPMKVNNWLSLNMDSLDFVSLIFYIFFHYVSNATTAICNSNSSNNEELCRGSRDSVNRLFFKFSTPTVLFHFHHSSQLHFRSIRPVRPTMIPSPTENNTNPANFDEFSTDDRIFSAAFNDHSNENNGIESFTSRTGWVGPPKNSKFLDRFRFFSPLWPARAIHTLSRPDCSKK